MYALSGITIIFILDKEPKYGTVRLNTGDGVLLVMVKVVWQPYTESDGCLIGSPE